MELGTSAATLVSNAPEEIAKIKSSKKIYLTTVGSLTVGVVLLIVVGLLTDQVIRSNKQLNIVTQELREIRSEESSSPDKPAVCWSKECILSAAALMESIDETVDPCEDFHMFACGGWKKNNPIPRDHGGISQFGMLDRRIQKFINDFFNEDNSIHDSKAVNNTRDMYNACMNTGAIEEVALAPLIELLNSYGQWPMTIKNWTEDRFDWRKATASIRSTLGYSFLFEVSNFLDINNTDYTTIYIDQPSLGLPSFLLKGQNMTSPFVEAYATFIYGAAVMIRDSIGGEADNATIVQDVEDMISFHVKLANILSTDKSRSSNIYDLYNPFLLSELQNLTDEANATNPLGQIDWHEYLNDIYSVANVSIDHDERLIVLEPKYLQKLIYLMDQTSPRVIANFIHWRLVFRKIYDLNQEMNVLAIEFWDTLFGPYPLQPRMNWCRDKVEQMMGFAIGSKYIETNFHPKVKEDVEEMIVQLKMAFSSLVEESSWMDHETKINALEKAAAMKEFIAYPDWINNRTTLESAYRGIETREDRHFANLLSAERFMIATNLRFLRFRTDRENLWISFPVVVNAFYFPMLNSITFPAGILSPPFFGRGRLAASNYGGIGMVIGHEITHGFDHEGHKSDKKGHRQSWWTNHTLSEFYKRKQCIVDEYSNYSITELKGAEDLNINGSRTQGENIADNGGIREAFRAYQNYISVNGPEPRLPGMERYTPEQIFFLSFANIWCENKTPRNLANQILYGVHSPSRYRILGPLSNSADFAEHFQCPVGSPMNKPKKCIVW